jgi:benzoate/toluate 1,2-dioxygenase reductase subunit
VCYKIALNFEDGVTRFVDCKAGEKVLDAAFRNKINLPMDCSDGVCGTCKCRAESGAYDMGEDYIEDALTEDEAAGGLVLTCQMVPTSDCVLSVPTTSLACKTGQQSFAATVTGIEPYHDAAVVLELAVDEGAAAPAFLPGQYVNIDVPGSGDHRSYSFSTAPGDRVLGFLIKKIPGGVMGNWLARAKPGDKLNLTGPMGSSICATATARCCFWRAGRGLRPSCRCWRRWPAPGRAAKST